MKFGKLDINPMKNPAVLDTATWDPKSAWRTVSGITDWKSLKNIETSGIIQEKKEPVVYTASRASHRGSTYFLMGLDDGQQVFVETGKHKSRGVLGEPHFTKAVSDSTYVTMYKTDAEVINRYVTEIKPDKGPRGLGPLPRLGIGVRMSASVWPAVWEAMDECGFCANAIQNSLRELNLLDDLLEGLPAKTNYLFSFGTIAEGHTGSTFEGLWTYGVLDALKSDSSPQYGADADHIMVKRGEGGLQRAKKIIEASRYYTFFTLDVSDIIEYDALKGISPSDATQSLQSHFENASQLRQYLDYHKTPKKIGDKVYELPEPLIGGLTAKYAKAFDAVDELYKHIRNLKNRIPFDLELSIDENPPHLNTCEAVTGELELLFIILEIKRRRIPITHIAPNFGVEKGVDYRCPDGIEGLKNRIRDMSRIALEYGLILDCHSGDDLSQTTRRTIGRASDGNIHFKISPSLQIIFAEVLQDTHPDIFRKWWDDTLSYARTEAESGSKIAVDCMRDHEKKKIVSPHEALFHNYNFATVGKRDENGRFIFRDMFYDLSPAFHKEYGQRVKRFLCTIAKDLFE
ncbi:MAG: hypothetical protein JXQ30_16480 [Spirochaetes bacterium]|nr:hypothetical protein [Spirochaetota bacterium]